MKTSKSIVGIAIVGALCTGFASLPSMAGESVELFFAYACGRRLCSNTVEPVPSSGLTRSRFVKTDRYISDASITFTVIDGKRVIVTDTLTIPIPGVYSRQHYVYEVTDSGPVTTWFTTNTDGEYDFFVITGREALAYTPYPLQLVVQPVSTLISTDGWRSSEEPLEWRREIARVRTP